MGDLIFPDRIHTRVLVVDDHPTTASTLARVIALLGRGIEPVVAHNGEQALQLAQQQPVDILVTDMMMPGINGIDLIKQLQSQPGNRPACVILVTAYENADFEVSAQCITVNHLLHKPINPERISQIIAGWIEKLQQAGHNQRPEIDQQIFNTG